MSEQKLNEQHEAESLQELDDKLDFVLLPIDTEKQFLMVCGFDIFRNEPRQVLLATWI